VGIDFGPMFFGHERGTSGKTMKVGTEPDTFWVVVYLTGVVLFVAVARGWWW
jgi:hypothetical protein